MNVPNHTLARVPALDPYLLASATRELMATSLQAGVAENTRRSYASAMRYWQAWYQLRFGQSMGIGALAAPVALQFVTDHVALPDHPATPGLPAALDNALVQLRVKARPGALALNTVE